MLFNLHPVLCLSFSHPHDPLGAIWNNLTVFREKLGMRKGPRMRDFLMNERRNARFLWRDA
jgi:hypothetical protein